MTDTPASYTDKAGQFPRVASGEAALEFALPVVQRALNDNLIMVDGESLVITGYLDPGAYAVECQGDSEIEIL